MIGRPEAEFLCPARQPREPRRGQMALAVAQGLLYIGDAVANLEAHVHIQMIGEGLRQIVFKARGLVVPVDVIGGGRIAGNHHQLALVPDGFQFRRHGFLTAAQHEQGRGCDDR
jgi:hypothetical protein